MRETICLTEARRGVQLAGEVLLGDDVRGVLRPARGEFDVSLLDTEPIPGSGPLLSRSSRFLSTLSVLSARYSPAYLGMQPRRRAGAPAPQFRAKGSCGAVGSLFTGS